MPFWGKLFGGDRKSSDPVRMAGYLAGKQSASAIPPPSKTQANTKSSQSGGKSYIRKPGPSDYRRSTSYSNTYSQPTASAAGSYPSTSASSTTGEKPTASYTSSPPPATPTGNTRQPASAPAPASSTSTSTALIPIERERRPYSSVNTSSSGPVPKASRTGNTFSPSVPTSATAPSFPPSTNPTVNKPPPPVRSPSINPQPAPYRASTGSTFSMPGNTNPSTYSTNPQPTAPASSGSDIPKFRDSYKPKKEEQKPATTFSADDDDDGDYDMLGLTIKIILENYYQKLRHFDFSGRPKEDLDQIDACEKCNCPDYDDELQILAIRPTRSHKCSCGHEYFQHSKKAASIDWLVRKYSETFYPALEHTDYNGKPKTTLGQIKKCDKCACRDYDKKDKNTECCCGHSWRQHTRSPEKWRFVLIYMALAVVEGVLEDI